MPFTGNSTSEDWTQIASSPQSEAERAFPLTDALAQKAAVRGRRRKLHTDGYRYRVQFEFVSDKPITGRNGPKLTIRNWLTNMVSALRHSGTPVRMVQLSVVEDMETT